MKSKFKKKWTTSKRSSVETGDIVQTVYTQAHEPGRLYVKNEQPTENLILEENKKLRDNPGVLKDMSFGRWIGRIPAVTYADWVKKYPELRDGAPSKQRQAKIAELLKMHPEVLLHDTTAKSATKYHQPLAALKDEPKLVLPTGVTTDDK